MITVRCYSKNHKLDIVSFERVSFGRSTVWIDCENPTKDELKAIVKKTGIHKADLSDCLDQSEKPRMQRDKDYFFFILGVPLRKGEKNVATSPMGIFMGKKFLLTIHKAKINSLKSFVKLEDSLKTIFQLGKERLVYNMLMAILKEFYVIIEEVEQSLEKIENKVVKASESVLHNILTLKNTLLYIRRTLVNNRDVISSVRDSVLIKDRELFQDLYVEFVQQVDMVEIARERLTVDLEIYYSSVSNRLNEVMKYFTVIASLILLPTLISGIYGMNFIMLPLKENAFGFWIMLGVMLTSMLIMLYFFKKKKWV